MHFVVRCKETVISASHQFTGSLVLSVYCVFNISFIIHIDTINAYFISTNPPKHMISLGQANVTLRYHTTVTPVISITILK